MQIIEINKPFYSAGKKYGWEGNSLGLGIAAHLLEGEGNLFVKVGGKDKIWTISKEEARNLVKHYNSFYQARGTLLGVIPWQNFKSYENKTP